MCAGSGLTPPVIPLKTFEGKNSLGINVMFNGWLHNTKGIQVKRSAARCWSFANNQRNSFQLIADANTEAPLTI